MHGGLLFEKFLQLMSEIKSCKSTVASFFQWVDQIWSHPVSRLTTHGEFGDEAHFQEIIEH